MITMYVSKVYKDNNQGFSVIVRQQIDINSTRLNIFIFHSS